MRRLRRSTTAPSPLHSLPAKLGPAVAVGILLVAAPVVPVQAAEKGVIQGVVVNVTTGRPQPGVRLLLRGGSPSGADGETARRAATGADGTYRFEGLPTGDDHIYALDARYEEGLFAGSAITIPSGTARRPVIDSRLKVWETTADPGAITVVRDALFLVQDDDGVGVIESVIVANTSDEAYIGRGAAMSGETRDSPDSGGRPSLGYSLPAAADKASLAIVESDLDLPELLDSQFGFSISSAIPPGETRTTFSYRVTGGAGIYDLTKTALYPTETTSVYASEPLRVTGNRLAARRSEEIGGRSYRLWSVEEALEAGDTIQIGATAEADVLPSFALAAIAAGIVAALGLAIVASRRSARRRTAAAAYARSSGAPDERGDLITAIAQLDIAGRNGDISEDEWRVRRADLKDRFAGRARPDRAEEPGRARPDRAEEPGRPADRGRAGHDGQELPVQRERPR